MIRDTTEYLKFYLHERDNQDLSTDAVQVAVVAPGATPTWLDCTFVSAGTYQNKTVTWWRTTDALVWDSTNFPATQYQAYAKVIDNPETPWASLGTVYIYPH